MVELPDCSIEQAIGPLKRIDGCALDYDDHHIDIKFAVGMAQLRKGGTIGELIERADSNMYEMKRNLESPRDC